MAKTNQLLSAILFAGAAASCASTSQEDAESFEISLHSWACLEPCRPFGLSLDGFGRVHVHNPSGEPRLATFDVRVPEQDARELHRSMLRNGFMQLLDRYSSDAGMCEIADRKNSVLALTELGRSKQIVYARGCMESQSDLSKLLDMERQLRELTAVDKLLARTATADCDLAGNQVNSAPVYTLREPDATGTGLLRFTNTESARTFIVQGCSGHELTRGSVMIEPDCNAEIVIDQDSPKRWPGRSGEVTKMFISGSGTSADATLSYLSILATRNAEVASQVALQGASCE